MYLQKYILQLTLIWDKTLNLYLSSYLCITKYNVISFSGLLFYAQSNAVESTLEFKQYQLRMN